jgi:uncharacterized protein YfaS (alpha-2-macroglobulin family)
MKTSTTRALMAMFGLVCLLLTAFVMPAAAQSFDLPGVAGDAAAFQTRLAKRYPAGGTDAGRRQSEAKAAAAATKQDWTAAAQALEDRLGQGRPSQDLWQRLAEADMSRVPPAPTDAVLAAYLAFEASSETDQQAAALLAGSKALLAQKRPAQAGQLLQALTQLVPDDPAYAKMLADANKAAGLQVQKVTATEDADPPRACIAFNVPPSHRNDFHAEDWVKLEPAIPDAAVTREGDQICVSGLPLAASTTAVLRAGMPADGGLSLEKETRVKLALGNRTPTLIFNDHLFILPRGQAPRIALTSANISAVKLSIVLFTERTALPWIRDHRLGQDIESYVATSLTDNQARTVWTGSADITGFRTNALMHTVLPLPADAMKAPGLYAVVVQTGDGQPADTAAAVQPILQTDLAPTVWRGTDGLTVQVRSYSDAKPRAGVALRLMAQNNDVLAEAQTDADGTARFAAPLLQGEGVMAASAIQGLTAGDTPDFVSIDLEAAAFDLSDRGVSGAKQPGPLDSFIWSDRGIYRPGETVQLMALLRDNGGAPVQRPAHLRVLRPNGGTFTDTIVQPGGGGSLHLAVPISNGAAAGIWTAQVLSDPKQPPIGEMRFKVDAFVPDRMAVTIGKLPPQLGANQMVPVPVTARFLYGAPAAHLTGSATVHLAFAPQPPAALDGFEVGLVDEAFAPQASTITMAPTDDQGLTSLPLAIAALPDTTHPVQASLDVEVDDPSGHATHVPATVPVRPATNLIGVKRLFKESVDAGAEAGFDIAAINPDGARIGLQSTLRLVRERPDWRLVNTGRLSSYQTVWRDEPLETHDMAIPADGVLHFARRLPFGRYRIEVTEKSGLAATSIRFRSGWATSDSPDVPDRADVSADKQSYPPGAVAHIHVAAPFGGPATLLVMTNRLTTIRTIDVPAAGGDVDVPVDAAWGPGAYVGVHVYRGGTRDGAAGGARPDRAIGLVWVGIDPAARRLPLAFEAPDLVRPRLLSHATIRTTPGAWVSVAAVDEGILHLTDFQTPDPGPHFLGRRALGVDIRDDWGRLIAAATGDSTLLRQGGDESAARRPNIPQQIVSMFQAPVQADAEGRVDVPLPFPDFNGQVRLMAVAWDGTKMGSAAQDIIVRDPLVAEPLLPRYLAPGDTGRLAVLLQNLDLSAGPVSVTVSTTGPLSVQGAPTLTATLAKGAQAVPALMLHADGAGIGHVMLAVDGPDGFHATHEAALDIHSARPVDTVALAGELAPDQTQALAPPVADFVPGTWQASATFGGSVRYDVRGLVASLGAYPLLCIEQVSSKGLPLAVLPDGDAAGPDRANRLQRMANAALDHERFDGAFGMWSSTDEAEPWLSLYATEFLLRAQKAGATVPSAGLADAVAAVVSGAGSSAANPEGLALQAYRLYVMALAGQPRAGANRVLFESLSKLPTPLAKAQLGAALALGNDTPRAEQAFAAALDAPGRTFWMFDHGSALRDQAAVATLLRESGLLTGRLATLAGQLPGASLKPDSISTQDRAWLAAAAGTLGRTGEVTRISLDGRALPPSPVVAVALTGPASARNTGDRAIWRSVSVSGVLAKAPAAARAGMTVKRQFFAMDGSTLDLGALRQNTVFTLLLEGTATDGQAHRVQLLQGLPAGWEIAGRIAGGTVQGLPWLGTLTGTEATPAADDSFQAVMVLSPDQPDFRIAVRLRATTPGNFELPGAAVSDMDRPGVFARQASGRIDVLPAP